MLIVSAVFEFVPEGFDRIREVAEAAVAGSRQEPGNHAYNLALDATAPDRVTIFEVWDDQAALDNHFEQPYMEAFVKALSEANIRGDITHYDADIYDVSGKRGMGFELPTE